MDHLLEEKVALAIAVPLRRRTHRPSCCIAQRATGAIMDHLLEEKVAPAIAVPLRDPPLL